VLQRKGADNAMSQHWVGIIRRQNQHLSHIVNDLLDGSRLLARKITLEKIPLDLAGCVNRSVEALFLTERAAVHIIKVDASPV